MRWRWRWLSHPSMLLMPEILRSVHLGLGMCELAAAAAAAATAAAPPLPPLLSVWLSHTTHLLTHSHSLSHSHSHVSHSDSVRYVPIYLLYLPQKINNTENLESYYHEEVFNQSIGDLRHHRLLCLALFALLC